MGTIRYKKLHDNAIKPTRAHFTDAGVDLYSIETKTINSSDRILVGTGISLEIPYGYAGFVQPKSGLAINDGITVLNTPGLIDSGYRGEIKVILYNAGHWIYTVERGDKIAQLVIVPIFSDLRFEEVNELSSSDRNEDGFGSTGIKLPLVEPSDIKFEKETF